MLDDFLFFVVDAILDFFHIRSMEREQSAQEIVMRLLPLIPIVFICAILGMIWFLER